MTGTHEYRSLGDALARVLDSIGPIAVAASGGVDSTTLAVFAHRRAPGQCTVYHATSPAVPPQATARLRDIAEREGWRLRVIDAGEFADPDYRRNPVNRCFYCKTNLYDAIAKRATETVASGTNCDDLGDFRPGLEAARARHVRHPYVEAGIGKSQLRAIAAGLGYVDLGALPSSPCLSSRVETGIAIEADALRLINDAERHIQASFDTDTVRCRLRRGGVVVELDDRTLSRLDAAARRRLMRDIGRLFAAGGRQIAVSLAAYKRGSAFVHGAAS